MDSNTKRALSATFLPAIVAIMLVVSPLAKAVVINFEDGVFGSQPNATGSTYTESGFDFRTPDVAGMHLHLLSLIHI